MSDHEDNDEYEGLRILGDDDAGGDDELPHWSDAPAAPDGDAWADDSPQWESETPDVAPSLDDLGGGSVGSSEFNPSILPPDEYSSWDDGYDDDGSPYADDPDEFGAVPAVSVGTDYDEPAPEAPEAPAPSAGRDLPTAIGVGVGLGALALLAFYLGKRPAVVLIAVVLAIAAVEFYTTLRSRGYNPLTLPGIAAIAAMPIASYWRGPEAVPLILFLTVVTAALWYLLGISDERPVPNIAATLYGVVYIGVLGSFGGLMLSAPNGIGMLLAVIIVVVAYDIGAYAVGSMMGRSTFSSASPNKTVEGLLGGGAAAIVAAIVGIFLLKLTPFGDSPGGFVEALSLGVATAIFAPLGDLSESMIKRDLGVKDMGTFLPGHGGLLDRFDGMLFMLPVAYYLVRLFELF